MLVEILTVALAVDIDWNWANSREDNRDSPKQMPSGDDFKQKKKEVKKTTKCLSSKLLWNNSFLHAFRINLRFFSPSLSLSFSLSLFH